MQPAIGLKPPQPPSVLIIGAGITGMQCALTLVKENPSVKVILVDENQYPGGKVLGILDEVSGQFDTSGFFYSSDVSHRLVERSAKNLRVNMKKNPLMFGDKDSPDGTSFISYDQFKTHVEVPEDAKKEFHEQLFAAKAIAAPDKMLAAQFLETKVTAAYTEAGFKVPMRFTQSDHLKRYLAVGGYGYQPLHYSIFRCAFDLKSARMLLPGQTELITQGMWKALPDDRVEKRLGMTVVKLLRRRGGGTRVEFSDGSFLNCGAVISTLPACQLAALLPPCSPSKPFLESTIFQRYRGYIIEVENLPPPRWHVMDWTLGQHSPPGAVAGYGRSWLSKSVVILQLGMCAGPHVPDLPDSFYLSKVQAMCTNAGLGAVQRVRGKKTWVMGAYFPDIETHQWLQDHQGEEGGLFFGGSFMFVDSLTGSMAYATTLARRVLTTLSGAGSTPSNRRSHL